MIRLIGDDEKVSDETQSAFVGIAASEKSHAVVAQLACTARRFTPLQEEQLVSALLENPLVSDDSQLPLLVWWAMEDSNRRDTTDTVRFPYPPDKKLEAFFNERTARRLMSDNVTRGRERIGTLFGFVRNGDPVPVLRGVSTALQAHPLDAVPPALRGPLAELLKKNPTDLLVLEVLARMKDAPARAALREIAADEKATDANRLKAVDLLRQVRDPRAEELFLEQLAAAKTDALRVGLLGGLEAFEHPSIGEKVLARYSSFSPAVKKKAVQTLLTRPAWALMLLKELDAGKFPKTDVTVDNARTATILADKEVTALVEKHFGRLAPATPGEKQARITWLNVALGRAGPGDAAKGKLLFTKHCAACHQLHGEGGKVGADLTTADRKNRGYLLSQIVDPSGYIRPEFVVYSVLTKDDRKLSGIVAESGESITLTNVVNDQVVKTTVAKADIADLKPSPVSLMPEKLLDTLTEAQIADLFAYLASDAKTPTPPAPLPEGKGEKEPSQLDRVNGAQDANSATSPLPSGRGAGGVGSSDAKKLKVALVSGSFEYKSDDSMIAFQKHLEATGAVECVRIFAKAEKDTALAGIENLEKCDVAVFFTRRLQIEGDSLDAVKKFVKSGKPIVGVRTASHGFQKWLEMDKDVFGGDYKGHFGAGMADVKVIEKQKDHAILKDVKPFTTNGSLYKNPNVAADITVLLQGTMGKESEPVAWTREKDGRRVFYTSLGHPDDFKDANFVRLLTNGLAWAAKVELKK